MGQPRVFLVCAAVSLPTSERSEMERERENKWWN